MMIDLSGKRALVCGASQGIGAATAFLMAELGASVVLLARREDKLNAVLDTLPETAVPHAVFPCDLMQIDEHLKDLHALAQSHPFDILINNTGGPAPGPIHQASSEQFMQAFQGHLVAHQILAQALLPGMKAACYGRIINVLSTSVKQPIAGLGVSNTIRASVANWAKTLAAEVAPWGVTVNNVLPGFTQTERLDAIIANRSQKQGLPPEQVSTNMKSTVPMARFAEPQELAQAICFLASPAANYITGINLPVDGGRLQTL